MSLENQEGELALHEQDGMTVEEYLTQHVDAELVQVLRALSLEEENPANTTEWIAPMRAQASIATAPSTHMGM